MKAKIKVGIILCLILILIPNVAEANSPTMHDHYVDTVKPYSFIAPYEYEFSPKIRSISGYFYTKINQVGDCFD